MEPTVEMLALLREIRDSQEESLRLARDSQALYKRHTEEWVERERRMEAEWAERKALSAEEHAAYMKTQEAYFRNQTDEKRMRWIAVGLALLFIVAVGVIAALAS